MLTKETAIDLVERVLRVADDSGRWDRRDQPSIEQVEAIVNTLFVKPGVLGVLFHWSTKHGECYDCGLPAAFLRGADDERYSPELRLLCAICAANAAADGEIISRISS